MIWAINRIDLTDLTCHFKRKDMNDNINDKPICGVYQAIFFLSELTNYEKKVL